MLDPPEFVISFDAPPSQTITFTPEPSLEVSQHTPKRKQCFTRNPPRKKKQTTQPEVQVIHTATDKDDGQSQQPQVNRQLVDAFQNDQVTEAHETSSWCEIPSGNTPDVDLDALFPMDVDQGLEVPDCSTLTGEVAYSLFIEAVQAEECGFYQLSQTLFIANGWDMLKKASTASWYYINQIRMASGTEIACLCPEAKVWKDCLHSRFLVEHGDERFSPDPSMIQEDGRMFLFSRFLKDPEDESGPIFSNLFSVYSPGLMAYIKTWAVVEHEGNDNGSGHWMCSKDPKVQHCPHIVSAQDSLQQYIQQDGTAKDSGFECDFLTFNGK